MEAALPDTMPVTTQPKAEIDIWLVEAWVGYRMSEMWELIGGLRYQYQDISLSDLPNPPFLAASAGLVSEEWTDWFLGTG